MLISIRAVLRKQEKVSGKDYVFVFLFAIYGTAMAHFTLLNRVSTGLQTYELDLFWSYRLAHVQKNQMLWTEIFNNIILFVPFGFLLPCIYQTTHRWWIVILLGCVVSIGIEVAQLIGCLGLFEYDDIFNNTLGTILGYSAYRVMECLLQKKKTKWNLLWLIPSAAVLLAGWCFFGK